MNLIKH